MTTTLEEKLEELQKRHGIQGVGVAALKIGARAALEHAADKLRRSGYNATTAPDILDELGEELNEKPVKPAKVARGR
jgi:hypothetical protein